MRERVTQGVLILGMVLSAPNAFSQTPNAEQSQPAGPATTVPAAPEAQKADNAAPPAQAPAKRDDCDRRVDAADKASFDERVIHYAKAAEFTRRLEAERAAEFAQSAARYARLIEFTRNLEAKQELEREQEFNERVARYVRLHEFTKRLSEQRRRSEAPPSNLPAAAPDHTAPAAPQPLRSQ